MQGKRKLLKFFQSCRMGVFLIIFFQGVNPSVVQAANIAQVIIFSAPSFKTFGDPAFTLSATGGGSGNPIIFSTTTTSICTISGSTVTLVSTGACIIAANQAGNSNYNAASEKVRTITIDPADQTINFTPPSNKTFSDEFFPISATGGGSNNPVTFSSTTESICTVNDQLVTIVSAGLCNVAANQAGNDNYNPAPTVIKTITIDRANQTINFTQPSDKIFSDETFSLNAIGGASNTPVIFSTTTAAVCTVSGNTVTLVSTGTCSIAANQSGNSNYNAAPEQIRIINIEQAIQTINFSPALSLEKVFGDADFTLDATGGDSGNPIIFSSTTESVCTVSNNKVIIVSAGLCSIVANQAGNGNYIESTATQLITISKANQIISIIPPSDKIFGDADFLIAASGGDSNNPITFSSTTEAVCTVSDRKVTIVSPGECRISANQTGSDNFNTASEVTSIITIDAMASELLYIPLSSPCRIVNTARSYSPFNANQSEQSFLAWGDSDQLNPQRDSDNHDGLGDCLPESGLKPSAIAANVTAAAKSSQARGNIVAYPFGTTEPTASLVNFRANNIANSSIITLNTSSDQHFTVQADIYGFNLGGSEQVNVIVDALGYFYPQNVLERAGNLGLSYLPNVRPCRIVNTGGSDQVFDHINHTEQGFLAWGNALALDLQRDIEGDKNLGGCVSDYSMKPSAVMANVTAVGKRFQSIGHLVAYPNGRVAPNASLVNFNGNNIANASIISLKSDANEHFDVKARIFNHLEGGSKQVDVIVDTQGYFYSQDELAAAGESGLSYVPLAQPCRIVDTRGVHQTLNTSDHKHQGFKAWGTAAELNQQRDEASGHCQPVSGMTPAAMIANVTAAAKRFGSVGHLVAYSTDSSVPDGSLVNFSGNNIANSSIITLGDHELNFNIEARIFSHAPGGSSQADVIVDVIGYFY